MEKTKYFTAAKPITPVKGDVEKKNSNRRKKAKPTDHEADGGEAEPARGVADLFWPEGEETEHDHNQADSPS